MSRRLYVPAPHSRQLAASELRVNWPASQLAQADAEPPLEYFPAAQLAQYGAQSAQPNGLLCERKYLPGVHVTHGPRSVLTRFEPGMGLPMSIHPSAPSPTCRTTPPFQFSPPPDPEPILLASTHNTFICEGNFTASQTSLAWQG